MLGTKEIERLAGLTTRAGLTTEIAGVKEVAAPYMEMNTKELLLEGAKLVRMGRYIEELSSLHGGWVKRL